MCIDVALMFCAIGFWIGIVLGPIIAEKIEKWLDL